MSFLSDVLEMRDVPPRYFLTAKACAGIIRRAEKRGKALPSMLKDALQAVVRCSRVEEAETAEKPQVVKRPRCLRASASAGDKPPALEASVHKRR